MNAPLLVAEHQSPTRDPGRCYRRAGFKHVGFTAGGLWALQLLPGETPDAALPSARLPLFAESA